MNIDEALSQDIIAFLKLIFLYTTLFSSRYAMAYAHIYIASMGQCPRLSTSLYFVPGPGPSDNHSRRNEQGRSSKHDHTAEYLQFRV